jgi:hypothetical protein
MNCLYVTSFLNIVAGIVQTFIKSWNQLLYPRVIEVCWTFTFCVEKSYDGTHLSFGGTLDRRCHFKHVSLKQGQFYHCQTSTAHR